MEPEKQQLTYPLDYVTKEVLANYIKEYFASNLIPPSYTTAIRDTLTPKQGMVIFNSTTNKLNYHNGTIWEAITSA